MCVNVNVQTLGIFTFWRNRFLYYKNIYIYRYDNSNILIWQASKHIAFSSDQASQCTRFNLLTHPDQLQQEVQKIPQPPQWTPCDGKKQPLYYKLHLELLTLCKAQSSPSGGNSFWLLVSTSHPQPRARDKRWVLDNWKICLVAQLPLHHNFVSLEVNNIWQPTIPCRNILQWGKKKVY